MSSPTTYVYLMSGQGTVRVSLDYLALWYCRKLGREVNPKTVNWAKGRLKSFGCNPCQSCNFTGQKQLKFLGEMEITIKKGTVSNGVTLDADLVLPTAKYFLQAPVTNKTEKIPA